MSVRTYVSEDRCTMVQVWSNNVVYVMTREHPDAIWGPPVPVVEER